MRNVLRKILLIGVIAMMIVGALVLGGCANRDSIWHESREDAFEIGLLSNENVVRPLYIEELVRNETELQQLTAKYDLALNNSVRYDQEFFEEYALIFIYFEGGTGNNKLQLNDIRVSGNVLEVHRTRYVPRGFYFDVRLEIYAIIEIRQIDVGEVTGLQIVTRERKRCVLELDS